MHSAARSPRCAHAFVSIDEQGARTAAAAPAGALAGLPISVKDLYDIAGQKDGEKAARRREGLPEIRFEWDAVRAIITRFDAAQIDDHLDPATVPRVVLMNPPFSVMANVEGRVADAAFRHIASALARLAPGGVLYFSNNFRKFILDEHLEARYAVEEIIGGILGRTTLRIEAVSDIAVLQLVEVTR